MSISNSRLQAYVNYLREDEECLSEIARRMSVRYWAEFKDGDAEARATAAAKQDNLDAFMRELQAVLNESIDQEVNNG